MDTDEDEYEVYPENTVQSTYLKSLGFSSSDFVSKPPGCEVSESKFPQLAACSTSFINSVHKTFTGLCAFVKEIILPTTEYAQDVELLKHSGLLFKENVLLVEEFSPSFSSGSTRSYYKMRLFLHLNFSIVLPLATLVLKVKKVTSASVLIFLSLTSMYSLSRLYGFYLRFNHHHSIEDFVSSLKQYNQKFLKSLQFISEKDKVMMKNYSSFNKMEISGFNSYKVLDPSWLHFKTEILESAVLLLKNFHSLCQVLNELSVLRGHHNYQSICSVNFCELGISEVETTSHQAYLLFLNKLKLLLFLVESELLSFIAINLSQSRENSWRKISIIFSAVDNISKLLLRSSSNIEYYFNRLYDSGDQQLLFKKNNTLDAVDSEIVKVFLETRALSHSALSAAVLARNFETFLENQIRVPKLMDKIQILSHADEALLNIEYELISSQRKLKSLARHIMLAGKSTSDPTCDEGIDEENSACDRDSTDIVKTGIEVGQSNFNPMEPDEVFVGVAADDVDIVNTANDDDFLEEHFIAKAFNRSSKNLIKELKVKLKDKKCEMVEREKIALQRQNTTDVAEIDNLAFESSDEDDAAQENSDYPEVKSDRRVLLVERLSACNVGGELGKLENVDSVEDSLDTTLPFFESSPPQDGSSSSDKGHETATKNTKVGGCEKVSNACSGNLTDSEQKMCNPLAMSVANISRMWNQELSRSEECFGSDSETSSDCDN